MEITYDIKIDNCPDNLGPQFLAGSYDSIKEALRALPEFRQEFPDCYITKSVMTRCRVSRHQKGR